MPIVVPPTVVAVTPAAAAALHRSEEPKRLQQLVVEAIRIRHYSRRTEQAYWHWVKAFVLWSGKRHPIEMGAPEISAFLTWLATERNVAASTQRQALSALLFLYKEVLQVDLPWVDGIVHAKQPRRLPCVLSQAEVARLWPHVSGARGLVLKVLYGSGLRLMMQQYSPLGNRPADAGNYTGTCIFRRRRQGDDAGGITGQAVRSARTSAARSSASALHCA